MASGAPDWQRIVTVEAEVEMGKGAPDWERIVVGAGGTPIGASGLSVLGSATFTEPVTAPEFGAELCHVDLTNAANTIAIVTWSLIMTMTNSNAAAISIIYLGGLFFPITGYTNWQWGPGVAVDGATFYTTFSVPVELDANASVSLNCQNTYASTGSFVIEAGSPGDVLVVYA